MEQEKKPIWEILDAVAEKIKDPVAKAEAKATAQRERAEHEQRMKELVGRVTLTRFLDISAVLFLIVVIIVVIILFSESLFEGFVSSVVGFWIVRYVFKKRSNGFLSKFVGWF